MVAAAFDTFPHHSANGGSLPARKFRLGGIAGQPCRFVRVLGGLIADAQAHEQLTEFELGDKAVGRQFHGLAQLFHCRMHLEIDG